MGRDKVLGLSLAILLIGFAGAFCFRNEPFVETGLKLARAKILDEAIAQRPGPKPYAPDPKIERHKTPAPTVTLQGIQSIDPFSDVQTGVAGEHEQRTASKAKPETSEEIASLPVEIKPATETRRPAVKNLMVAAITRPRSDDLDQTIAPEANPERPPAVVTTPPADAGATLPSHLLTSAEPPLGESSNDVVAKPAAEIIIRQRPAKVEKTEVPIDHNTAWQQSAAPRDRGQLADNSPRDDATPSDTSRDDTTRDESNRDDSKKEEVRSEASKSETANHDNVKRDNSSGDDSNSVGSKSDASKNDSSKRDTSADDDSTRDNALRNNTSRDEATRDNSLRNRTARDKLAREIMMDDDANRDDRPRDSSSRSHSFRESTIRDSSPTDSLSTESHSTEADGSASPIMYRVRRGDTLSKISLHYLGDGSRYREIYNVNRDQLRSPDDRLKIGMTLRIPRNTGKSASGPVARRKSRANRGSSVKGAPPRTNKAPIHNVSRLRETPPPTTKSNQPPVPPSDDETLNTEPTPTNSSNRFVPVRKSPFLPANPEKQESAAPAPDMSHFRFFSKSEPIRIAGDREDVYVR